MFTGIIEEVGKVEAVLRNEQAGSLKILASRILDDLKTGDSISVNGVCLTVTAVGDKGFTADVMPETLRRSNLGELKTASPVNLERALPVNGRFGGHIVSGHIDGTGKIVSLQREDNAIWVHIRCNPGVLRYIVQKGSIAVDGISLTVAGLRDDQFSVSLIPLTQGETILTGKKSGETVNLECDILGKYIERFLETNKEDKSSVSWDLLKENGYL